MWPKAASLCSQIYSTFHHLFPEIQLKKTSKPSAQSPLHCSEAWTISSSPRKRSDQISFPPQRKSGCVYAEYFINIFIHGFCRITIASCLWNFKSAINFKLCNWNKDTDASVAERKEEKKFHCLGVGNGSWTICVLREWPLCIQLSSLLSN